MMIHPKFVWSSILFALVAASVEAMDPQLLPLPAKGSPNTPPGSMQDIPRPDDNVQFLQENVNVVSDGNQEVDLSLPPKRTDVPVELEVVPLNAGKRVLAQSGAAVVLDKAGVATGLPNIVTQTGISEKRINSTLNTTEVSTDMNVVKTDSQIFKLRSYKRVSTEADKREYCAKVSKCVPDSSFDCAKINCGNLPEPVGRPDNTCPMYCRSSADRMQVCLLMLVTILIMSTLMTCSNSFNKDPIVF